MIKFTKTLLTGAMLMLPLISQAHEGHGVFRGHELAHYLASPAHAVPIAVMVALTMVVLFFFARAWVQMKKEEK